MASVSRQLVAAAEQQGAQAAASLAGVMGCMGDYEEVMTATEIGDEGGPLDAVTPSPQRGSQRDRLLLGARHQSPCGSPAAAAGGGGGSASPFVIGRQQYLEQQVHPRGWSYSPSTVPGATLGNFCTYCSWNDDTLCLRLARMPYPRHNASGTTLLAVGAPAGPHCEQPGDAPGQAGARHQEGRLRGNLAGREGLPGGRGQGWSGAGIARL